MTALSGRSISVITLLLICCFSSFVSCRTTPAPNTVEVEASANCHLPGDQCIAVTRAFVMEHAILFEQTIRLKAALKVCQQSP